MKTKDKNKKTSKKKETLDNPTKGIIPGEGFPDDLVDFCTHPGNIKYFVKTKAAEKLLTAKSTSEVSQLIYEIIKASAAAFPSTPKKDLNIPQEQIDSLYGIAHQMYEFGKYSDAADVFRLILMIDRENYIYNFSLAACFQMMEDYRKALTTYMSAALIEPSNPMPHYHSAECHIKLHDTKSAIISLTLMIKIAGDNEEYHLLKERCKLTKTQLIKQLKERKRKALSKKGKRRIKK